TLSIAIPLALASCSGGKTSTQGRNGIPANTDSQEPVMDKSIADYTEQIRLDPKKLNERGDLAHHRRGTLYAEKGEYAKAIADFTEAIRLYPVVKGPFQPHHLVEVHAARAKSYEKTGEHDKAILDYTEVIKITEGSSPNVGDALL